ncbi:hypothetical protein V4C53_34075 [Paraburkholderia azotifigens]
MSVFDTKDNEARENNKRQPKPYVAAKEAKRAAREHPRGITQQATN